MPPMSPIVEKCQISSLLEAQLPETNHLIEGFWIWKVKSREGAIEWADAVTPELREQEEKHCVQARASVENRETLKTETYRLISQ
jgi:hypothetical protein